MFLLLFLSSYFGNAAMDINFQNIQSAQGSICVAIYNRESAFLKPDQVYMTRVIPVSKTGVLSISLPNLPAGEYAVSCFHDLDGNGKLNTNMVGIPSEPYGFSNNARPRFRAPVWSEARFYWNGQSGSIPIRLEKW